MIACLSLSINYKEDMILEEMLWKERIDIAHFRDSYQDYDNNTNVHGNKECNIWIKTKFIY